MAKKYNQLSTKEREKLYTFLALGHTQAEAARRLGRNKSTISRELSRNSHERLKRYLPDTAQRKAEKRKLSGRKDKYIEKDPALKKFILEKLAAGWSPELIAGRTKRAIGHSYNYESIYQYIYSLEGRKANLRQYLIRTHRIRYRKRGRKHWVKKIPNRVGIEKRPVVVAKRQQFGHWEGDSVLYKRRQPLATQTERKTGFTAVLRPLDRTAAARAKLLIRYFSSLPWPARRSITFDNGLEFAEHESLTRTVGMNTYFADAYKSWQRGINEHSNGLLRFYLPRGTDLDLVNKFELQAVMDKINNRPQKRLGFLTPAEAFAIEMNKIRS